MKDKALDYLHRHIIANPMVAQAISEWKETTGLCTVREAVTAMLAAEHNPMELWYTDDEDRKIHVEIKITCIKSVLGPGTEDKA